MMFLYIKVYTFIYHMRIINKIFGGVYTYRSTSTARNSQTKNESLPQKLRFLSLKK